MTARRSGEDPGVDALGWDQEEQPAQRAVDHVPASARPVDRRPIGSGLLAPQQHSSTSVGVEPDPGQLPAAVLGLDRQPDRRRQPRHVGRQSQRHPLVVVGQVGLPARGHPTPLDRRHARPAPAITCTPAPEPDTTYRVSGLRRRRPGSSVAARFDDAPSRRVFRSPDRNQRRCSSRSATPRPVATNPPGRTGALAPGTAGAASADRCRTPAARRRGCRRPAPAPPGRRRSWWRPSPARSACSAFVPDGVHGGDRRLPSVQHDDRVALCDKGIDAGERSQLARVTACRRPACTPLPSALPSTSVPSARRAIAVKSVSCALRRRSVSVAPRGDVEPEVAAPGRPGTRCRAPSPVDRRARGRAARRYGAGRRRERDDGRGRRLAVAAEHHQSPRGAVERAAQGRAGERTHLAVGRRVDRRRHCRRQRARSSAAERRPDSTSTPPRQRPSRHQRRCELGDRRVLRATTKGNSRLCVIEGQASNGQFSARSLASPMAPKGTVRP